MSKLVLKSNAKVNLSLDVLGVKDKNPLKGYHYIQTIFHEITPENTHGFRADIISVRVFDAVKKSSIHLPKNFQSYDSTLFKAANLIVQKFCNASPKKIEIEIEKNIPIGSGLGGGSSNGAAVLKALNKLLNLKLPIKELESLAVQIGMDAPFFIRGGVAFGENFGELITHLPDVKDLSFQLFPVSELTNKTTKPTNKTASQFASLDLKKCGKNLDKTTVLLQAIKTGNLNQIHKNLHNDFETLLEKPLPKNHHLSGSGPSYFLVV